MVKILQFYSDTLGIMKNFKIFYLGILICLVMTNFSFSQNPFPNLIIENLNINSGNYTYINPLTGIISPSTISNQVTLSGSSSVNYFAGTFIKLNPGFSASSYDIDGKFLAQIHSPDFQVVIIEPFTNPLEVPEFEKLELGIKVPIEIQSQISNFLLNGFVSGINPYNPDEIDVYGIFTSPTQKTIRWNCFYYQDFRNNHDYNYNDSTWTRLNTEYPWRMRFSPNEIGQWKLSLIIKTNSGLELHVNDILFACTPNPYNQGYLVTGLHKRNLKFSKTDKSFFIIGENLPWSDVGHYFPNNTKIQDVMAQDYSTYQTWTDEIQENGGNFISIGLFPWCYGIEWEHLGIFDAHDGQECSNSNANNRQINAWELDRIFNLAKSKGLYIKLPLLIQEEFQHSPPSDNCIDWEHNPYHLELPWLQSPIDFFTSPTAINIFTTRYLRYVVARWGYSTNLAWYETLTEIDNFAEYSFPLVDIWNEIIAQYLKSLDGNHLIGVGYKGQSTSGPSHNHSFGSQYIDFSQVHHYGDEKSVNVSNRWNYAHDYLNIWNDKPFLFGEIGPSSDYPCADNNIYNIHNSIWSTAFMGGMGCGLQWSWQTYMHPNFYNKYYVKNFKALSQFMIDANFEEHNYAPHMRSDYSPFPYPPFYNINYRIENFWLINHSSDEGRGWVHNAVAYWANEPGQNCGRGNEDIYTLPYSNHNDKWILDCLNIGQDYEAHLYNIEWNDGCYYEFTQGKVCNIFGQVKYPVGDMFERHDDYAYKLDHGKSPVSLDSLESEIITCPVDTIYASGIYGNDTAGIMHYKWDFGNGILSTLVHPKVYYNTPGIYTVTLIVTDSILLYDTVRQTFIVPDSCFDSIPLQPVGQSGVQNLGSSHPKILIYPNPTKGLSTILMDNEIAELSDEIQIYSIIGSLVKRIKLLHLQYHYIDLRNFSSGTYVVKIETRDGQIFTSKIILSN